MKRVVAYIRVSTDEQGSGDGPAGQRRAIEAWAQDNSVEVVSWHEDIGTSGAVSPLQRQVVLAAVKAAETMEAEGIVVDKADRWTRGGLEDGVLSRAQLAKDYRLMLHIVDMPFGLDQLVGQIVLAIRDAMAAEWLRVHKERVQRGVDAAMRSGWPNGKPGRPAKPALTPAELDMVLHMLDCDGWPRMAHAVSAGRGAFVATTVAVQRQRSVTETWLRNKMAELAKENSRVSLALAARRAKGRRSNVDVETEALP